MVILAVSVQEGAVAVYPSFPPYSPSILYGPKKDSVLDEESIADTMRAIPHATFARAEKGAPLLVQENPVRTAEEVTKFLMKTYPTISKGKEGRPSGEARL